MPMEKIVLNASPLILFCNSDLAFVLPELFSEIVVEVCGSRNLLLNCLKVKLGNYGTKVKMPGMKIAWHFY